MFNRRSGITLIEIVVAVTILTVLGIVLVNVVWSPSETFTGIVNDAFSCANEDGSLTYYSAIYRDDLGVVETFTVTPGPYNVLEERRYAFRVRGSTNPRAVVEAIPIP